jgi:thioesterase superfamily protein 4
MNPGRDTDFNDIPWCAELIKDPSFEYSPTYSRQPKDSGEDSFFAETLRTDRTIRRCLSVNSLPNPNLNPPIREVRTFLELGSGLNGYPNVCHGGFVATMLDEVMGVLLTVNQQWMKQHRGAGEYITQMTVSLNIKYRRPVKTPGIILAVAKVIKTEPRKWWIRATIEDSRRTELAIGEALFIEAKSDPRL